MSVDLSTLKEELALVTNTLSMKTTENNDLRENIQHALQEVSNKEIKLREKTQELKILSEKNEQLIIEEEITRQKANTALAGL